ncbi:vitamin B12 ABC transporter ATP-binding protein BtuD [Escherichia coli]|uniref:vitamin B12 ABC transporter ATP-binding protein BtuD n=1 Tax=Escherichia coli TaxID=562 RepID=UPI0010CB8FB8|nr:vitamin B12 ABC transporter ATP-binding protein BtuD [Escherichia coli]EJD9551183.1 vitamin B12 ABC transporter ATP-binding protein BtuD [Escherichia coli]EJD9574838.1 vitamin B12 ABC transporter ATP-binding protein BtuD [Escherichia coli]MBB8328263.1 vitamin B12 ABC transporter ATP-binding protein BtuD [Escherichia coli]MED9213409.1 vitamin B12 ABC transporter ATP-binding protein BtuD [Escherichia coli]GCN02310.1 vitamin B12 ABC transporter ATPase [Escherichia coli]
MPYLMNLCNVTNHGRLLNISGDILQGEIIHLIGPNGSGKSTLLERMSGLTYGLGDIFFRNRHIEQWSLPHLARHRAWLSQHQSAPFAMPVWHYLSLHTFGNKKISLHNEVTTTLSINDKLNRKLSHLSGGEWQRVRLAGAILQIFPQYNRNGQLLLLDEPMNNLDIVQQNALDDLLKRLCSLGVTIIMSGHDLNHSLRNAHKIWLINKGSLIDSGETYEMLTPLKLKSTFGVDFQRINANGNELIICKQ